MHSTFIKAVVTSCLSLTCSLILSTQPLIAEPVKIAIAGDSTVQDYSGMSADYAELKGWGQYIAELMEPGSVTVLNHAKGGRSSKSFAAEGRWEKLLAEKPAYVLIQFAHNDNPGKGPERETLPGVIPSPLPAEGLGSKPEDWYRHNMEMYLTQAIAAGIKPIVVTPMERRSFKSNGKSVRDKNKPWADAATEVATALGVPVIDLNAYSVTVYNRLGFDGSVYLHPKRAGELDNTHYNETGARIWAEFIVSELGKAVPDLQPLVRLPATATVDKPVEP